MTHNRQTDLGLQYALQYEAVWIMSTVCSANIRNSLGVQYAQQFEGTVYSMEWSPGVECWSGVLEWSQILEWKSELFCHPFRQSLYFKKYQENKLSFCRCGCEFLSDLVDLYFWGNHNDTKLKLRTGGYH